MPAAALAPRTKASPATALQVSTERTSGLAWRVPETRIGNVMATAKTAVCQPGRSMLDVMRLMAAAPPASPRTSRALRRRWTVDAAANPTARSAISTAGSVLEEATARVAATSRGPRLAVEAV